MGGGVAVAAVHHQVPVLCFAINPEHASLVIYFVDCAIATAIQEQYPGNRLHDAALKNKVKHALLGTDESSDAEAPAKKRSKKEAKEKEGDSEEAGSELEPSHNSNDEDEEDHETP